MYIQPNTTIKIIKNCPLDIDYANTIYFTSIAQQTAFFINTLGGYTLQNNTYQRVEKGKMRVALNAEVLYNCNYLAFQNSGFGNKWFYAFITRVDYINNVTSEITYEIDIMQTWHFNYILMDCFVEREHSVTDNIGDNLVPEKLDTGEYVCDGIIEPTQLTGNSSRQICFWCTFDDNLNPGGGELFNQGHANYYSGLIAKTFPLTTEGIDSAVAWLSNIHANKINGLVSCCVIPSISDTPDTSVNNVTVAKKTTLMRADGTAVKNKKCLTYPYNAIYVTNNQGKSAIFRYEFFSSSSCVFRLFADKSPSPTVLMYPLDYKGAAVNFDEKIDLSGFPQIALNIDSYKAWLAQNASSIGINALVTSSMAGAGESFLGAASLSAGAVIPIVALAGLAVSGAVHAMMPPHARGSQGSNVLLALDRLNFGIMQKHITPEFASIIDDYFSMYGYATNRVKRPNRNARPEWNYVKTIGCKIDPDSTAGLPADDAKAIEDVYNKGITFWNNPAHIGDYSQNNSPTI